MGNVIALGFLMGLVAMFVIAPKEVYRGIMLIQYGSLTKDDKAKSWIPVYNIVKAESTYTGKVSSIFISFVVLLVLVVLRFVCVGLLSEAVLLNGITGLCAYVGVLVFYGSMVVFNFRVLNDAGCVSFLKMLFLALIVPVGQDYIGKWLPQLIKHSIKEEEGTF